MKTPKLESRSFDYEGAYGSEQLDLTASKDVWKQLDIEVQKAYERGLAEGRRQAEEEDTRHLAKGLAVVARLQKRKRHDPTAETLQFNEDLTWLSDNYVKAIQALAHMRSCGDCAEDSWDLCSDGLAALKVLEDGGRGR